MTGLQQTTRVTTKRFIVIASSCGALCALATYLVFTILHAPDDPSINGKTLSEHIHAAYMRIVTANSEYGQMSFLASLSESQKYPHRVLPILFSSLTSTNPAVLENRAQALGNYGALAADALPQLSNLMNHPKGYVHRAASNAIQAITHPLPTVPIDLPLLKARLIEV
jgi:hypothetical protein